MAKIGITTTVPIEVIYAAGHTPVDLNNVFITGENPTALVEDAELAGYPRNLCAWIKGIYATVLRSDIKTVVAVTQGDCSNTHALMETLQLHGVKIIPFAYPFDRDYDVLHQQIEKLMARFQVDWPAVNDIKKQLDRVRGKIKQVDQMTWQENLVHGWENHLWQVNCSDFEGEPSLFEQNLDNFIREALDRVPLASKIRLGYLGVPPIMTDLYDYLEERNARVVFNETQRQFAMPFDTDDLVEQYLRYTYPYDIFARIDDVSRETSRRRVDGLLHYAQSFCFRQIQDLIVRKKIQRPILTLEGDKPGKMDARTKMRLDSFVEMLQ